MVDAAPANCEVSEDLGAVVAAATVVEGLEEVTDVVVVARKRRSGFLSPNWDAF